ncbi:O-antigen ligase family protein [Larkinella insperata]|uniref:O-antigen ligase family protein n=1 Tax=Larkinella insperata TaxID=332158 RepID=A0ABW3QKZ9_9BACT|nr:O-antigen ligase family protein [Larkinella insperata]
MNNLIAYDKYLARLVMICFFLPNRVQIFILMGVFIYWAVRDNFFVKDQHFRPYGGALLLGSIYLLYAVCAPFTNSAYQSDVLFDLEQKASLFAGPFAFLLMQPQTRKIIAGELIYFVYACFISCLVGNLFYLHEYGWHVSSPDAHIQYRLYFEKITGMHPTYMGIYLCFASAILLISPKHRQQVKGWKLVAVQFPLFLFLMALMPKAPVIALFVILCYYAWINRAQKHKFVPILAVLLISLSIACISIPFSSQRIGEFSAVLDAKPNDNPMDNSVQMRQVILSVDLDVLAQNWVTGLGPGGVDPALKAKYEEYARRLNVPLEAFDTHNEYLNQWLSFGLIGITLFILVLGIQFANAVRRRDHLYAILLMIFIVTFFTENVWSQQKGITFYSFFTSLFFFVGMRLQPSPVEAEPVLQKNTSRPKKLVHEIG